jgi:hypothetical protein
MNLELTLRGMVEDVIRQYRAQEGSITAVAIHLHREEPTEARQELESEPPA